MTVMNGSSYSSEPTIAELLRGLVSDAKLLMRQELALAKREIYTELGKTKAALLSLSIGIGIAAIGGLLLIIMLVHLLHALTPLPLWACYGIVGGALLVLGGVFLYRGKEKIAQIEVVPQQTLETMQENIQWIKAKVSSNMISKKHVQR
jgi:Putative Actinobacterial Holin-X, holin superfamily III